MKIAIASGKGGTGKTTVATNLAYLASLTDEAVTYLDCDVEEPNGHLFLKPRFTKTVRVKKLVPRLDKGKCENCGKCSEICAFGAIACVGKTVLTFPELCHACGGCFRVCPTGAISEVPWEVGQVEIGQAASVSFVKGVLDIGQAMSPPIIQAVKAAAPEEGLVLIDAPPGTSCPVIESIRDCDYVILVTEPTPFGLNDLALAVDMVRALRLPFSVVINRADVGDGQVRVYCQQNNIEVLAEIPDDRRIAEAYARGELICAALPDVKMIFAEVLSKLPAKLDLRRKACANE